MFKVRRQETCPHRQGDSEDQITDKNGNFSHSGNCQKKTRSRRVAYLLSTVLISSVVSQAPLRAQTSSSAADADQAQSQQDKPATANKNGDNLQEVVVSARRRAEKAEDVPASVTSLSFAKLDEASVADTKDLLVVVPGLTLNHIGFALQPNIRGIGSSNGTPGDEANVATYIDGVYMSQEYMNFMDFPDVERVEVLKGPQGTLFGRNATGGAISVATLQPSNTFQGNAGIEYGSFNTVTGNAYVTGPLATNLAGSVSGFITRDDGYIKDILTDKNTANKDGGFIRAKLRFTPTDKLTITLSGNYANFQDNTTMVFGIFDNNVIGGTAPGAIVPSGKWQTAPAFTPRNNILSVGGSLNAKYEFDDFDVTSITARQSYINHLPGTDAPIPLPDLYYYQRTPDDDISQEFQISSKPNTPVQWVGGLYYFNSSGGYSPIYFESFGSRTTIRDTPVDHSYAAFGEATIPIVQNLSATIGLRYSYEDKSISGNINGGPEISASKAWENASPRFVLQYEFPELVNVYASYNKGFKSGVFNSQTLSTTPVQPEIVEAYEVGAKSLLPGGFQASIAGFHYNYSNIQIFEFNPVAGSELENAAQAEINGIETDLSGATSNGLDGRLSLAYTSAHYSSYSHATEDVPTGVGGNNVTSYDASGKDVIETPRITVGATIGYHTELAGGTLSMGANYFWSSGQYYDPANTIRQGAYATVNANISWAPSSGAYKVTIRGTNLTNRAYYENIQASPLGDNATWAEPRYIGGRIQYFF